MNRFRDTFQVGDVFLVSGFRARDYEGVIGTEGFSATFIGIVVEKAKRPQPAGRASPTLGQRDDSRMRELGVALLLPEGVGLKTQSMRFTLENIADNLDMNHMLPGGAAMRVYCTPVLKTLMAAPPRGQHRERNELLPSIILFAQNGSHFSQLCFYASSDSAELHCAVYQSVKYWLSTAPKRYA